MMAARLRSSLVLLLLAGLSLGCASYQGTARDVRPSALESQKGWVIVPGVPLVLQEGSRDCGAAALSTVLTYWGKPATPRQIAEAAGRSGERLKASELQAYARSQGLSAFVFFGTMKDLVYEIGRGRPVIVGVGKPLSDGEALSHYQVVVGVDPTTKRVLFLDPARGWRVDSFDGFAREWSASKAVTMVAFPKADAATRG